MIRTIIIATLLLGVVACGEKNEPAAEVAPVPREPAADAPPAGSGLNAMLAEPLPEGVEVDIPSELRRDRTYTDDNGDPRRRVVLDLVDGEVAPTFAAVEQAFVEAGFKARELQDIGDGASQMRFRKQDYGVAVVTVRPTVGSTTPGTFTLIMDWRPDPVAAQ